MRNVIIIASLLLATGCPNVQDCEWATEDPGLFQRLVPVGDIDEEVDTCFASNIDTTETWIVIDGPLDIDITAAVEVGDTVEISPETAESRVAILTAATDEFDGLLCIVTPAEDTPDGCDEVRLACDTHEDRDVGVEIQSGRFQFFVNGYSIGRVAFVSESFAARFEP